MKFSDRTLTRYALTSCIAAAMLAGCGGSHPPIGAQGATPQTSGIATGPDRGKSWMLPEAKSEDLLYASNLQNVTVYSYPAGKHVGTLKGFYRPYGECVDSTGDVFIANQDTLVEYKHGGKKPVQTLTFSGYESGSCATDPTTGNLAVTWDAGFSTAYVAIYEHGSDAPTLYNNGTMLFTFCGYDNEGNLFVDGVTQHGDLFQFAELPKNGTSMVSINLDQSIGSGGNVQWDGKYVTVPDVNAFKIYRFAISGSSGTLKGTVDLGNAESFYETWVDGNKVVGADILGNAVWYWNYPAGGAATKSVTKGVFRPYGVTISKTQK
jgi:hypothetical protein